MKVIPLHSAAAKSRLEQLLFVMFLAGSVHAADFTVAPAGDDSNDGTAARPFATLARAREAVRDARKAKPGEGATVWIESGTFHIDTTFELGPEDSGTSAAPVTWRARKDGAVVLDTGRRIPASAFEKVANEVLLARMADEARGKIWQLDLAKLGVQHAKRPPDIFEDSGGLLDLYCNGQRQPLSRWPNDTKTTMERVLDRGEWTKAKGLRGGTFVYRGDRPARWAEAAKADQLWLAGFWRVAWEWETIRVQKLDLESRSITHSQPAPGGIGSKYAGPEGAGTEPWIAVNLLEEIDRPGEWSIDFAKQTLYWWPPAPLDGAEIVIADRAEPVVRLTDAAHVTLRGLVIEHGLGNGIEITGGDSCAVAGCTLRKLGQTGVVVRGGVKHAVLSSDFHTLGHGGILLGGGDRKTLTPAGHIADNNHIHDYALAKKLYTPGIGVGFRDQPAPAVGCIVTHNLIHHAPHAAILYGGNDHLFELNEIHDFLIESDDLGGFYSTYDWTSYGNTVRHNFIHDTPHALGIYLDDGDSGDVIEGNIAYRMATCAASGGGHDNTLRGNLAIECRRGVAIDARGVSRGYATNATLLKILAAMNVTQPPWRNRFPTLAAIAETHPPLPVGCVLESNVAVKCDEAIHLHGRPDELRIATIRDNLALPIEDFGFADAEKRDFRMKPGAAAFTKVSGFQPIPFEKIGLYQNDFRSNLPAHPAGTSNPEWGRPVPK